jgi:hypothetical protein
MREIARAASSLGADLFGKEETANAKPMLPAFRIFDKDRSEKSDARPNA